MKPLKVALFAETSSYYIDMLFGLARGFESLEVETYVGTSQLSPQELYTFCRQYKPSVVFELNRSRTDLPDLDQDILHRANFLLWRYFNSLFQFFNPFLKMNI